MTSESHTQYGSRVCRQGKSRWNWRNHASNSLRNAGSSRLFSMARRDSRTCGGVIRECTFQPRPFFLIEENDVRRAPHRVREKAAGLAGYDDFEDFW